MKTIRTLAFFFIVGVALPALSQDKKFDKSLKKVDRYYAEGDFLKASANLVKLRKSIVAKLGQKKHIRTWTFHSRGED